MTIKTDDLSPLLPSSSTSPESQPQEQGWISWGFSAIWKPIAATANLLGRTSLLPPQSTKEPEQFYSFPEERSEIQDMTEEDFRKCQLMQDSVAPNLNLPEQTKSEENPRDSVDLQDDADLAASDNLKENEGTSSELIPLTEEEKRAWLGKKTSSAISEQEANELEFRDFPDHPVAMIQDLTEEDQLFIQSYMAKQQAEGIVATPSDSKQLQTWVWTDLAGRITKAVFICGTAAIGMRFLGSLGAAAAPVGVGGASIIDNGICFINETLAQTTNQTIIPVIQQAANYAGQAATKDTTDAILSAAGSYTPLLSYVPLLNVMRSAYQSYQMYQKGQNSKAACNLVANLAASTIPFFFPLSTPVRLALAFTPALVNNAPSVIPFVPAALEFSGVPVERALAEGADIIQSYIPGTVSSATSALEWINGSLGGAPAAFFNATVPTTLRDHPYLTALTLTAGGAMLAYNNIISPMMAASDSDKPTEFYEKKGVTCELGTFNVKVPVSPGMSLEDKEALIQSFVQEMLEKTDLYMEPGDRIDFTIFPDKEKEWEAKVTPKILRDGKEKDFKQTHEVSDAHSIDNFAVLRKVMAEGAHCSAVMTDLHAIAAGSKAPLLTAASVVPVGFQNGTAPFTTAIQMLLSIPGIREKMKTSNNPLLQGVAIEYEKQMKHLNQNPRIELQDLENSFRRPPKGKGIRQHLSFSKPKPPKMDTLEECIKEILDKEGNELYIDPDELNDPNPIAKKTNEQKTCNELSIEVDPALDSAGLQALVDGQSADQFYGIPKFLNVQLTHPLKLKEEEKVPGELTLTWKHIDANAKPRDGFEIRREESTQPKYRLHSFVGKDQAAYQETTEIVHGSLQHFYWKTDAAGSVKINKNEFETAVKTSQNLIYLKLETDGSIPKNAILATRNDILRETEISRPAPTAATKISFELGLSAEEKFPPANRDGMTLMHAVQTKLENSAGKTELVLPVPLEGDDPNWSIGIMWHAIKAYLQQNPNPFKKITLVIPNKTEGKETSAGLKKKREQLISEIEAAETIYQNNGQPLMNNPDAFHEAWNKRHQSLWRR